MTYFNRRDDRLSTSEQAATCRKRAALTQTEVSRSYWLAMEKFWLAKEQELQVQAQTNAVKV